MSKMLSKKRAKEVMDIIIKMHIKEGEIYEDWCLDRIYGQLTVLSILGLITEKEQDFVQTAIEEICYQKMKF